jgi:hypothetical protein
MNASKMIYAMVLVEFKRFWQWCVTLRTTGIMDFIHRPDFEITRKENVSET